MSCERCIWRDKCQAEYICDDFTPEDSDVEQFIEDERHAFHKEWNLYAYAAE